MEAYLPSSTSQNQLFLSVPRQLLPQRLYKAATAIGVPKYPSHAGSSDSEDDEEGPTEDPNNPGYDLDYLNDYGCSHNAGDSDNSLFLRGIVLLSSSKFLSTRQNENLKQEGIERSKSYWVEEHLPTRRDP